MSAYCDRCGEEPNMALSTCDVCGKSLCEDCMGDYVGGSWIEGGGTCIRCESSRALADAQHAEMMVGQKERAQLAAWNEGKAKT